MRVLIVGAGAVGQVYGRHLQLGGAEVTFLVKEKYLDECRAGYTLYPLRGRGRRQPVTFHPDGAITAPEEVAASQWDQIWLCVSATALRAGWLDETLAAAPNATVVLLTPGLEDREYLLGRCQAERIVGGVITLVSYQAPLASEDLPEPGVAYWFPPFSASPFDGEPARVDPLVRTLKRGGCPAKRKPNAHQNAAMASAVMMPHLVALESEGWSLRSLRRGKSLADAVRAAREAQLIVARHQGRKAPFARRLIRRTFMRLLLALAPKMTPFPLETYLEYHFTKVGDQTRFMIHRYIERGRDLDLPVEALQTLARTLTPES